MGDNLPLIPGKSAVCGDVKPVLREVFREVDQLPPLLEKTSATDDEKLGIEKYNSECEEIWQKEGDLKKEFAKRISKKQPQNLYTLHKPARERQGKEEQRGMIGKMDLMPGIEQNAAGDQSLWVQNILNRSSCDFSYKDQPIVKIHRPLRPVGLDESSRQTYSVGELIVRKPPPPPAEMCPPPLPDYVCCIPQEVHFVNFSLDRTYTQQLRLVNVSKFEIRLSVSLPCSREFEVELSGTRGLRVTAGSDTELKIHFRPSDVRTVRDELRVRTSLGKGLIVPIACYMEPPELHIFVQKMESYHTPTISLLENPINGGNVVDLGTRLLGDQHCAAIVMQCYAKHASFFLLTEDAWLESTVEELTSDGSIKTGPFTISPARWAGGGVTRGIVRCRATTTGFQVTDLRILSSTAVTRSLHVVADSVYFSPDHISVQAQEKDYDITSDDDPECEYYVHLGTAFPNRSLSSTLQISNHSPMAYSFYWKFRPWGVCSCWQDNLDSSSSLEQVEDMSDQQLCCSPKLAKQNQQQNYDDANANARRVLLEPVSGSVQERSACTVHVHAPDVGARCGTQRAVLLLVLKDIPVESFPPKIIPNVLNTRTVDEIESDGKTWTRKVCDIVQAQIEVWWEVVPIRFVLDPSVLPLTHSRRVKAVPVSLTATQLHGCNEVLTSWVSSAPMALPSSLLLSPSYSVHATLSVPLPSLPNEYPDTDVITLKTATDEWAAHCHVTRACATRHPALAPARVWLGVVPPGAKVAADLEVFNGTYQDICWWATPYRWTGENPPSKSCAQAARTCAVCQERTCTCSLLRPSRGALAHDTQASIHYEVYAPSTDRIVATLVRVARTGPDVARVPGAPATNARASLIAYRVLAPRLVLRVFPCDGNKKGVCEVCGLDPGEKSPRGCTVLRPSRTLAPGSCSCYRLRITNTSPIPTTVRWEHPVDGEEFLRVKFSPNDLDIGSYAEKEISVVLEPRKVCGRRLFVLRAQVAHAYKPLYLVIDTAIDGVHIICEVPLGGGERNESFVALRGIQKEAYPHDGVKSTTPQECFLEEDRRRAVVQEDKCNCHFELKYIPPIKPLKPPRGEDDTPTPTEIVTSPPTWTRICECFDKTMPVLPEHEEPSCLQFRDVPLRTVKSRRLTLRNVGRVTARWRMVVRRWPRRKNHAAIREALTTGKDRWAGDVGPPGVVIQCLPDNGVCAAGQSIDVLVQVYADCWGLYYDQIMLMVDHVDPIVVDVWIEVVGPPLQFATAPSGQSEYDSTMWLSSSDLERTLRVKNTSRSHLTIHAYTLLEHEHTQDVWPFRLYMRFMDVPLPTCPCSTAISSESLSVSKASSSLEEMGTDIELYFAEDYGLQDEEYYRVEPQVCTVEPGAWMTWRVSLNPTPGGEPVPPGLVLLRTIPDDDRGDHWRRCEPPPARLGVRVAPRAPVLRVSCRELRARLCALELHYAQVARIRKRFFVKNIGNAPLSVRSATSAPWQIVMNKPRRDCGGQCDCRLNIGDRCKEVDLLLEPWSSTEMCVEVSVDTTEIWPKVDIDVRKLCEQPSYPQIREVTGQLTFYSGQGVLETLPLILEVEFPHLSLEPTSIDFDFVTHGDTRKTYFTVWHSSPNATIDLGVSWQGSAKLRLYPRHLRVAPGQRARVYMQYTAKWTGAPVAVEGLVLVSAAAGAGAWCRGALPARAQPARDAKFFKPMHDHTDQWNLWPPALPQL